MRRIREAKSLITILLAEDHAVVRQGMRSFLEQEEDFEIVGEAADGMTALRLATNLKPQVVVMDISMPKMSGIEATRRIKAVCPSIAVLVLSAYEYDQYVFALLEAGAAGYLLKDVSGQELAQAIRSVSRGDSVLHPHVARKVMRRFASGAEGEQSSQELLSDREREVLVLAARGYKNKEIAEQLFLSVRTVEAHLASIFLKLKVGSRTEAVMCGLRKGLLVLDDLNEGETIGQRPGTEGL